MSAELKGQGGAIGARGQFGEGGVFGEVWRAQPAFQALCSVENRCRWHVVWWDSWGLQVLHNPAIEVSTAQWETRLAEDLGTSQDLAAVLKIASSKTQQLGQWGCTTLASLQGHHRKINGAAPHIDDQQSGPWRETRSQCGGTKKERCSPPLLP